MTFKYLIVFFYKISETLFIETWSDIYWHWACSTG